MDLHSDTDTLIYEKFNKCGEITAALKVGKKVFSLHCGFCSRAFIELYAFTLHVAERHEQELFGCVQHENYDHDEDSGGVDKFWNEEAKPETTIEATVLELKKEGGLDFPNPLEQFSKNLISEEIQVLAVKEEVTMMEHEGNHVDGEDEYMDRKNDDADFIYDSSDTEINSEKDSEEVYHVEDDIIKDDETPVNDKLTLAIIKELSKHRILWDANKPMWKTRKQRIEAHETIAKSINKQLGMNLKWNAIRDRIKKLCSTFHSEVQKQKHAKSNLLLYTPIWYYDKLSFLNESINYEQHSTEERIPHPSKFVGALRVYEVPQPNLTDAQNLELIEIYKSFPCLWDVKHIEFCFTNRRRETMNEMIEKIKLKMNLYLTQNELQKIINSICNICKKEKTRKLLCERLKKVFTPLCKFYEQISFLNDNIGPFKCDSCEKSFDGFSTYKIHTYKVHTLKYNNSKPFMCMVCKKRYVSTHFLNIHMRCHTGEEP